MKYYIIALVVSTFTMIAQADEKVKQDTVGNNFSVDIIAGGKIGGAAPLSLPKEIRKINKYTPAVPFLLGVRANYQIDQKWGVILGLTFEGKGMNADATVKGYKTTFNANDDPNENMRGYYTGDITTKVHNLYLSIPVLATYKLSEKWNVQAGPYIAFAVKRKFFGEATNGYMRNEVPTGEKLIVDEAAYDFSKSVRNIDVGASLGTSYNINKKWLALAQFDYGFNNIMKTGFESISFGMHNIFMNVGIGYKL